MLTPAAAVSQDRNARTAASVQAGGVRRTIPRVAARASSAAWYVYLLRCSDGTLYTGSTNDLTAREQKHNDGRGAKYTAGRRPVRVVYSEVCASRSAAQAREAEMKRCTRATKEALVLGRQRA